MNTKAHQLLHPRLAVAGIVAVLLSASAITARIAASKNQPERADVTTMVRCEECGFVESTREVAQAGADRDAVAAIRVARNGVKEVPRKPARRYEVIVRMKDGSTRVFIDPAPVQWRAGERLIVIGNAPRSSG